MCLRLCGFSSVEFFWRLRVDMFAFFSRHDRRVAGCHAINRCESAMLCRSFCLAINVCFPCPLAYVLPRLQFASKVTIHAARQFISQSLPRLIFDLFSSPRFPVSCLSFFAELPRATVDRISELMLEADGLVRAGKPEEAIQAFDEAENLTGNTGKSEVVFMPFLFHFTVCVPFC